MQEGIIKFNCKWTDEPITIEQKVIEEMNKLRSALKEYNLIGVDEAGYGYGNISIKTDGDSQFYITGSQTGHLPTLSEDDISLVTSYDFSRNELTCRGKVEASSESLSHAALYDTLSSVRYVIHIHSLSLWEKLFNVHPTTSSTAEYGTVELANAISDLSKTAGKRRLFVLGGHREGILFYADSFEEISGYAQTVIDKL